MSILATQRRQEAPGEQKVEFRVGGQVQGDRVECDLDAASKLRRRRRRRARQARRRAGQGRLTHRDVPMGATTLAVAALQTSGHFGTGKDPQKLGSAHPRNAPYQAFWAADGKFAMAASNARLWHRIA